MEDLQDIDSIYDFNILGCTFLDELQSSWQLVGVNVLQQIERTHTV